MLNAFIHMWYENYSQMRIVVNATQKHKN